ncbi:MAG: SPOR domain-containing protein, partial [Aestuariivirga sp.]
AENDDMTADPVLSSTVVAANPAAQTVVVARLAPKAVEPPANLMEQQQVADVAMPAAAPAVETVAVEQISTPSKVVVASVPKIPLSKLNTKPAQADPIETAATDPAPTAAPTAQERASADAGAMSSSWAVQISSAASENGAWASFKLMQKGHKVLVGQKPVVVQADLGAKGTVYRVRFQGFDGQATAQSACAKLKAGGVACFVSKVEG